MKKVLRFGIAAIALVAVFFVLIMPRISNRSGCEEVEKVDEATQAAKDKVEPK